MGMILNKQAALLFAEKLATGMTPKRAYQSVRPNVTPGSAAVMGLRYSRNPLVQKRVAELIERSSEAGILGRQQIQELLSLAAITPKNAESLSLPENAWLIESDTGAGVRGISSLDALRELSRISGHYASPSPVASTPAHSLADCEDYAEMLEAEITLAAALAGRSTVEPASIGQREEIEPGDYDTSWMD